MGELLRCCCCCCSARARPCPRLAPVVPAAIRAAPPLPDAVFSRRPYRCPLCARGLSARCGERVLAGDAAVVPPPPPATQKAVDPGHPSPPLLPAAPLLFPTVVRAKPRSRGHPALQSPKRRTSRPESNACAWRFLSSLAATAAVFASRVGARGWRTPRRGCPPAARARTSSSHGPTSANGAQAKRRALARPREEAGAACSPASAHQVCAPPHQRLQLASASVSACPMAHAPHHGGAGAVRAMRDAPQAACGARATGTRCATRGEAARWGQEAAKASKCCR